MKQYRLNHTTMGKWRQGDTITEDDLRAVPGFAVTDEKNDETFNRHLNRLTTGQDGLQPALTLLDENGEPAKPKAKAQAKTGAATKVAGETEPSADGLDELKKDELLAAAEEEGVEEITASNTKQEIIDAIRAKRGGADNGDTTGSDE